MMKFSISTHGLYPAKIENVLEFIDRVNFRYLEIVKEYPYYNLTSDDLSSYDFTYSIHSPISDINIASHMDKIRKSSIREIEDSFRMANDIDAKKVVVHPGSISPMAYKFTDKILDYNTDSLIKCQSLAEEYGVLMCLENMPLVDGLLYSNLDALFEFVENSLHSAVCLDVGHAHTNGFSIDDMFSFRDIHHVHLSDNDGSYDMHDALGSGDIDFKKVFDVLEAKNYDEIVVIEVKSLSNIYKSIYYLKNIGMI
ncbi:MAG: sugar phosphate isomerase/epimerase [Methanosphaera sp.]|nr:sugar phosphate isomerase/epimerase [Methanosphaera sp.]